MVIGVAGAADERHRQQGVLLTELNEAEYAEYSSDEELAYDIDHIDLNNEDELFMAMARRRGHRSKRADARQLSTKDIDNAKDYDTDLEGSESHEMEANSPHI